MHNKGENDVQASETTTERTALVPQRKLDFSRFIPKAVEHVAPPDGVRRVRRGKFFLSNFEQRTYGSLRRPIFEYWGHGVVVGETVPFIREKDSDPEGMWCYAAHNDFDLVPEFMKPSEWPEYVRTETGWVRKDGDRRLEQPWDVSTMLTWIEQRKRLK